MHIQLFLLFIITTWTTATADSEDNRNYYDILGVSKTATQRDISKAFRKLALKYHPDKNKSPEAEKEFRKIAEAHEVLSKEETRRRYDSMGHAAFTSSGASGHHEPFDFNDFFRGFDFFRHHGHGDEHHGGGGFHFNFGDIFGNDDDDDDDFFGHRESSYSFAKEVRHDHGGGHGQRCETKTVKRGNMVITQTHCS